MNDEQQTLYRAHVRGAATWILLGKSEPLMNAAELVATFPVDLATATADIEAIVASERAKRGGVFERTTASAPQVSSDRLSEESDKHGG